jgi:hypothetical protein
MHFDHPLRADSIGGRKCLDSIRIKHDLQKPRPITQVDKNDPAMITPAMNPATNLYVLIEQAFGYVAAIMGSHGV